jgi:hypothetical protein
VKQETTNKHFACSCTARLINQPCKHAQSMSRKAGQRQTNDQQHMKDKIMSNNQVGQFDGMFDPPVTMIEAESMVDHLIDQDEKPMLWGPPGIGKTDLPHQIAAKREWPLFEFHAALRETVDLRGIPVADLIKRTTDWLVPNELPQESRDGPHGILYCDEINQASSQLQGVLGGLVLYGTIGDYRLPRGWRVICSGNRVADRASAQRMPTHMRNRLSHIHVKVDLEAWCRWASKNNIAPEMVAFLRLRPVLLHRMPRGDENAFPTPRTLAKASKFVNAPTSLRQKLVTSLVGHDVAGEFEAFIGVYRSVGSVAGIISDPDNANVPSEVSLRYAVATALSRAADKHNFAAVLTYAKRLGRESEMLIVSDSTARNESLVNTAAYGKWAADNADLTIQ